MYVKARIPLVCTYDSEADAAYVYLEHPLAAGAAKQMIPFDPADGMFNLDADAEGRILGLEILDARRHLPPALLQAIMDSSKDQVHETP
ncbi:DUF2283 domain-containing protein [Catellatospora sp. NPDC049133]|jgi:uncharacterized protein YuzE|uniref:DUF2283 domain-containing protein n=1 Tax=Catellatospora sp. NPDC049133 TaxID=3155499 RepID=UPI003405726F